MVFNETKLAGAFLIEPERKSDERGFFARTFCEDEFAAKGLATRFTQCNISYNHTKGTLRGLHYQAPPHEEAKLIRVTAGAIYDVLVDLREDSTTYRQWVGLELSAESRAMLYVPRGFAHGFVTLSDGAELFYQMSNSFVSSAFRGIRFDDPSLEIRWPLTPRVMSSRDRELPLLPGEPNSGARL